jgi:hypothetical protein
MSQMLEGKIREKLMSGDQDEPEPESEPEE